MSKQEIDPSRHFLNTLVLLDFQPSVEWVKSIFQELGTDSFLLVTEEDIKRVKENDLGDFEPEDLEIQGLVGLNSYHQAGDTHVVPFFPLSHQAIVPIMKPVITIGKRQFQIQSAFLETKNGWCSWNMSMVGKSEKYGASCWHSLDCRLLKERPERLLAASYPNIESL